MKKSALYTKTGDTGKTSLVGGERILKSDTRIELYGDIDELNSAIGVFISFIAENKAEHIETILKILQDTQSNLFPSNGSSLSASIIGSHVNENGSPASL